MSITTTLKEKTLAFFKKYERAIVLLSLFLSFPLGTVLTLIILLSTEINLHLFITILLSILGGLILCVVLFLIILFNVMHKQK